MRELHIRAGTKCTYVYQIENYLRLDLPLDSGAISHSLCEMRPFSCPMQGHLSWPRAVDKTRKKESQMNAILRRMTGQKLGLREMNGEVE